MRQSLVMLSTLTIPSSITSPVVVSRRNSTMAQIHHMSMIPANSILTPIIRPPRLSTIVSRSQPQEEDSNPEMVQDLRVPDHWLVPEKAREESEWLKVSLNKWLDDEYCPELTNMEISKVAAQSYLKSLLAKRSDLGDILLVMAKDLECISYQESFHGAFSSANAAIHLILQRIG